MNEETKQAVIDSIKHHKRMQDWVKTQPKDNHPNLVRMDDAINEDWHPTFCPLCKLYEYCVGCPLFKKYGKCGSFNYKNEWTRLAMSLTWEEWLVNDKKLVKQLKSLLNES
jgi:hypothetical protein